MTTIVAINKTNKEHLQAVKEEMIILGAPTIHAVYEEGHDVYVALEGSHRLTAAKELGIKPILKVVTVDDLDVYVEDMGLGIDDCEYTVEDLVDRAWRAPLIDFEDDEIEIVEA